MSDYGWSLERIADALERVVDVMEKESKKSSYIRKVRCPACRNLKVNINFDSKWPIAKQREILKNTNNYLCDDCEIQSEGGGEPT